MDVDRIKKSFDTKLPKVGRAKGTSTLPPALKGPK